jgi:hypothetical protein
MASMDAKGQYGFIEKEVRQHDNILLKRTPRITQNATTSWPAKT